VSLLLRKGAEGPRRRSRPRKTEFWSRTAGQDPLEGSTEREWIARCLEELGHEVIVADPNYAPMYAHRTRWVKTDRRDGRALAQACKLGVYRPAHAETFVRRVEELRARRRGPAVMVCSRAREAATASDQRRAGAAPLARPSPITSS